MNIRQKMLIGAGLLTLIPVTITAALLWQGASTLADTALEERTQNQLNSLRDTKRQQVTDEINSRVRALQTLAAQRSTIDAMRSFKPAFTSAAKDKAIDAAAASAEIAKYTQDQFAPEYAKRNAGASPDLAKFIAAMDPNGLALQSEFIVRNPNPLGQKERLVRPDAASAYGQAHAQFHPGFERAQKLSEFYDIFLIDTETDNIVYTVFKELDFGTSLTKGIASGTKLAEAYEKMKQSPNRDAVYLSDFATYLASYDDQAAFAAAPVFDGDRQIGVIAMQYPIDKITEAMSSGKAWEKIGLGKTGDIFLVGSDKLMRTNARYVIENKTTFADALGSKLSAAAKSSLLKKETSIGLVSVDTDDTKASLSGQEGYLEFADYRGIPSYGAYGPLKVQGLNWGMVAKIDAAEADEPINNLNRQSFLRALIIGLGVVAIAGFAVSVFLRQFLKPIQTLSDTVQKVASGETAARSQLVEKDEIGDLGRAFDGLLDDRIAALEKSAKENETLNNSVIDLLQAVFQLSNKDLTARAPVTEDIIGTVASSINQFSDETGRTLTDVQKIAEQLAMTSESVRVQSVMVEETARAERDALQAMSSNLTQATTQLAQVAELSEQSNKAAGVATDATQNALAAVQGTVQGMDQLRESISDMEKRFKRLGERSQEISTAVQLINAISERTHVLALNASMQAATAGEAGRGFAVVAEEVQRLSDSSRQATSTISQLVGNIQAETNETLFTVNRLIGDVVRQSELAQRAGVQMNQTQQTTQQLVSLVRQIAQFSEQQARLAADLQKSVVEINAGTEQTSAAIAEQTTSTQMLADSSRQLTAAVGQFKLA
ncbi:methyl-accepting chemotaxis protein [Variovorax sp. PCZ-1]|uniref:methyl-accepting chemotaxis protein n=1 Tax=Variovorax sp. PCZ-1 TaxID=2835533 RepID=UPI001BCB97AB|nr:methyl-accepting chemotaxis protein [Variovorax sp. PCZ-1]MBS7808664.1 HAMP domain-containing protein [Variovorax sp. PCZ-1]